MSAPVRLQVVCDSESYLKWAAHLADRLIGSEVDLVVLDSPIRPSPEQLRHAVAGTARSGCVVPVLSVPHLRARLTEFAAEVLLVAATGPVVAHVYDIASRLPRRPALISGLPGMGLPATPKAMRYRLVGDGFIVHSPIEAVAYADRARECGIDPLLLGTRLPMLTSTDLPVPRSEPIDTIVFAAQAKVPVEAEQRRAVLLALAAFARTGGTAVLKVRSRPGEQETHHEAHSYLDLLDDLIAGGRVAADEIEIGLGPMADFLRPGSALATVSSTAALESMDRGLPTLILGDFGVGDEQLNAVFAESGCIGTLDDLARGTIGHPDPAWLRANYFQPVDEALVVGLGALAERSRRGELPDRGRLRRRVRLLVMRARIRSVAPGFVVSSYRRLRYPDQR